MVGAGMQVFARNRDRYAEIGHNQFHGGFAAALRAVFVKEPQLFFFGEIGIAPDFGQILLKRGDRRRRLWCRLSAAHPPGGIDDRPGPEFYGQVIVRRLENLGLDRLLRFSLSYACACS